MPQQTYEITAPNGKTLEVTGDHVPTEPELQAIFKAAGVEPGRRLPGAGPRGPRPLSPVEQATIEQQIRENAPANATPAYLDMLRAQATGELENRAPDPEGPALLRFAQGVGQAVNPVAIAGALGTAVAHPIDTGNAIIAGMFDQAVQARTALDEGRYSEALGHGLGVIPVVGPAAVKAAERIAAGDVEGGLGEATGLVGTLAASELAPKRIPLKKAFQSANPSDAEAIAAMQARGVPIKLGVASGGNVAKWAQKLVDHTLGGAGVAKASEASEAAALTRVAQELAEQTAPGRGMAKVAAGEHVEQVLQGQAAAEAMGVDAGAGTIAEAAAPVQQTRYQSAESMLGRVQDVVRGWYQDRRAAYGKLEAAEQSLTHQDLVPRRTVTPEARTAKQAETVGQPLTTSEVSELERMQAELEALPYNPTTWNDVGYGPLTGNAGGGHYNRVAGSRGALVYDDIADGLDRATKPERGDMQGMLEHALSSGDFSGDTARAALGVARRRLAGDRTLATTGELPPGAKPTTPTQMMGLAVDLTDARRALRPVYEDLADQARLTPMTFVGGKAQALQALRRLMTGPEHAPLTVVDGALSDLKAAARGKGGLPELRKEGQGVAARMVGELEAAVRRRAAAAGPEVYDALLDGRAAHKAMVDAGELFEGFSDSPAKVFDQLFTKDDKNLPVLKAIAKQAPDAVPGMGRAWWERTIDAARHPDTGVIDLAKVRKAWGALGEQTKGIVFDDAVRANVDTYLAQQTPATRIAGKLPDDPAAIVDRFLAADDSHWRELRDVVAKAPELGPILGRRFLEQGIETATAEGGYMHAQRLATRWQQLGEAKKRLLFPDAELRTALDHFHIVAKRLAENPNPSGSALGVALGAQATGAWANLPVAALGQLTAAGLAKVMRTPAGVKLLTRAWSIPAASVAAPAIVGELLAAGGQEPGTAPTATR